MIIQNQSIRYKVVVEGVDSYVLQLPSIITSNFVAGEIVTGQDSGASAVVAVNTNLVDTFIKIKTKTGFYFEGEDLIGSVSGVAVKNGATETINDPYTNSDFGISSGTWTLYSDGDILTDIKDPIQKINISKGGNLSSGYTYGFSVSNKDLVKSISTDGVFFNQRVTSFYIGFVDQFLVTTWKQFWTGIIDIIKISNEIEVSFSCVDSTKANIEYIGSEAVPICLNRNYNCKLPISDLNKNFTLIEMYYNNFFGDIINILDDVDYGFGIEVRYSDELFNKIISKELDNVICAVIFGQGSGQTFLITNYYYVGKRIFLFLDFSYDSDVFLFPATSIIELRKYNYNLSLSKNPIKNIHSEKNLLSKPPRVVNNGVVNYLTDDMYEVDGGNVLLKNVSDNLELYAFDSVKSIEGIMIKNVTGIAPVPSFKLDPNRYDEIIDFCKDGENYLIIESYKIKNGLYSVNPDVLNWVNLDDMAEIGFYHNGINASVYPSMTAKEYEIVEPKVLEKSGFLDTTDRIHTMNISIEAGSVTDYYDVTFKSDRWNNNKDVYKIEDMPLSNILDSIILTPDYYFVDEDFNRNVYVEQLPENYQVKFSIIKNEKLKIENIEIGCNGENVFGKAINVDTPCNTIEYLLLNHYGKTASDINSTSFSQSDEDFSLFVNNPIRNVAPQIINQINANKFLADICYSQHLGMFLNGAGEYQIENWLPKSIVFSNSDTIADYDETNFISLSPIVYDDLNSVVSDFELKFNYSEATGEYLNIIRIKNTNENTFDFIRDTEGIPDSYYSQAFSAWQLAKSGYNRINKQSQTQQESKIIKAQNSDLTGVSEALSFVRNSLGHLNRNHSYCRLTVPLNQSNLSNELLSFISVNDQKITDGISRKGWIVERKLNVKTSHIEYKILLDIDPFDVFLYRVNVWSDGDNVANTKESGNYPTNTKKNGIGV